MKKIIYIVCIFTLCIGLCGCKLFDVKDNDKKEKKIVKVENISGEEVEKIVDNYIDYPDIDIIDIRDEADYNEKHIAGSLNIPYDKLDEISISNVRELIVYGYDNKKSKEACKELKKLGFKKVKNLGSFDNYNGEYEEGAVVSEEDE